MTNQINNTQIIENENILNYLIQAGKINLDDVKRDMKKTEMNAILEKHQYAIWQAKDGRWNTNVPEPSKPNGRWRRVAPTLEALHEQIYQFYKSKEDTNALENKTLSDLYPEWMEYKALHTKKSSYLSRIKTDWKKYYLNDDKGNFKSKGKEQEIKLIDIPIRKLTKLMLDEWVHKLIKGYDMTRKQYDNATLIVRQMLDYAVDLGIIGTNPMRDVHPNGKTMFRKVRKKSSESQVYSKDELAQLKELAWEDFYNRTKIYELAPLAVLFMFCTGLRISEVLTVRYEDLSPKGKLHISRMFCRDSKEIIELTKGTCGDRDVILTSEALHIIECAKERQKEHGREDCGYIFSIDGFPPSYHSVADLFRKYCANMEIERKSSHKARKTCISTMIDGGVNINTIREMVGHADERTTYNNYCFDRSTDAEKLAKIEQALS